MIWVLQLYNFNSLDQDSVNSLVIYREPRWIAEIIAFSPKKKIPASKSPFKCHNRGNSRRINAFLYWWFTGKIIQFSYTSEVTYMMTLLPLFPLWRHRIYSKNSWRRIANTEIWLWLAIYYFTRLNGHTDTCP